MVLTIEKVNEKNISDWRKIELQNLKANKLWVPEHINSIKNKFVSKEYTTVDKREPYIIYKNKKPVVRFFLIQDSGFLLCNYNIKKHV